MANKRFIDFPIATTVGDNDIILIWQGGANKQTTKATILSGVPDSLNDLTDVTISGLTNGQILRYDSVTGQWENTDQGNLDLNDLNDVTIVSPTNGQVLVYNSSTSKWENSSGGYVPYVGAVSTVNLGAQTIQAGSFVKQSGTSSQFLKADGSVDSTAYGTGSVTSVGLTMPAAFNVANSPITTSGTLAITGAGTVAQYIRGDGSLADFPESSGGGSSVSYYLNGSVDQGTIGGIAYKELSKVPILGAGTDFTINADGYIASFITDAGDPSLLEIPGGNWNFETYFSASSGGGSPTFYVELYKVSSGGTATLIASSSSAPELIAFGTNLNPYFSTLAVPTTTLALTDRLAVRYYVTHSGRTITLHTENNHLCQIITTFTTGITALNGLTAQVQNFAVGTTGTDFNIASATATHTFNLPTASATNRGALSSADWSTFNSKQNALTLTTTGTSGAATLVGATLNIPNYGSALSDYLPLTGGTLTGPLGVTGNVTLIAGGSGSSFNRQISLGSGTAYNYQVRANGDDFQLIEAGSHVFLEYDYGGSLGAGTIRLYNNTVSTASFTGSSFIRTGGTSSQYLMADGSVSTLTNPITGSGNSGTIPVFTGSTTIGNSIIQSNSTQVNIVGNGSQLLFDSLGSTKDGGIQYVDDFELRIYNSRGTGSSIILGSTNLDFNTSSSGNPKLRITQTGEATFSSSVTASSFIRSGGTSSQYLMADGSVSTLSNPITGTGTTNYLPKFTGSTTIGNSQIIDNGTQVGIGLTPNASYGTLQIKSPSSVYSIDLVGRTAGLNGESQISFWNAAQSSVLAYITNTGSNLYLGTGANQPFTLSSGGNFIFGTTSDNGARLQVSGTGNFVATINPLILRSTHTTTMWTEYYYNTSTISGYIGSGTGLLSDANASDFIVRSEADFVVATSGNNRRLTIASTGAATFSSLAGSGNRIVVANSGGTLISAVIGSGLAFDGTTLTATGGGSGSISGSGTSGAIALFTGASSIGNSVITQSSGNVLIGTGTAAARLTVVGAATVIGQTNVSARFSDDNNSTLLISHPAGTSNTATITGNINLGFATGSSGSITEKVRILANGNVLIGTTTDNGQKLQVFDTGTSGAVAASLFSTQYALRCPLELWNKDTNINLTTKLLDFYIGTSKNIAGYIRFENNNNRLVIGPGGTASMEFIGTTKFTQLGTGTVYSNNGVLTNTNPSDFYLKENIAPINYGLSEILKLNAVSFNWKNDTIKQGKQYGFIAQEVEKIMPDLVKKGEYLGLDKEAIFTTLVKAIQELKEEIDTLKY